MEYADNLEEAPAVNAKTAAVEKEERELPQDGVGWWIKWIKAAKKAADRHWQDSRRAYDEYELGEREENTKLDDTVERVYPIYWASSKVLEPAYYARTPNPYVKRRFDISDPDSIGKSVISKRLAEWLQEDTEFDDTMVASVLDFINADKCTTQAIYEAEIEGEEGQQIVSGQRILFKAVPFDEIIHSPKAKSFSEISEMAYYFCLSEVEAEKRFGDVVDRLPAEAWQTSSGGDPEDHDESQKNDLPGKYIEGWECWSKVTKKMYLVCPKYSQDFLAPPKEDPYKLKGFFPSPPFRIGSRKRKSLYPTPIYVRLFPTIKQLHQQYRKVFDLVDGIRRRALVDGSVAEVVELLNAGDQEFVAVQNLQEMVEKGILANLIYYLPVQELVQAIVELNSLEDRFKNTFYEWFGVPDILRGATDPIETAAAQEMKQGAAHDRFEYQKKQIRGLAKDSLEMLLDLALGVFTDDKIASIVGYKYMPPEAQQKFPLWLAELRNDQERMISIDFETDATSFTDRNAEQIKRNTIGQIVTNGLTQVSGMIKGGDVGLAQVAMETVLLVLDGVDGGREFEERIRGALEKIAQAAANPPQPPPPPPDYEGMKIQLQQEEVQMKREQIQFQMQKEQNDLMREQQAFQLQLQQIQSKSAEVSAQIQLSYEKLRLESEKLAADAASQEVQTAITAAAAQSKDLLEKQWLDIERFRVTMEEREKMVEEQRLAIEMMQKEQPKQELPQINIQVDAAKPGKKVGRIIRDAMGNATVEVEEIPG